MITTPIIFCPSETDSDNDSIYFLFKDGINIKLKRILYLKDEKENAKEYFELKASVIFFFCYHNGLFYLMDESM